MHFYLSMDCDNCDKTIYYGPCLTLLEHDDLPVVPFDIADQTTFTCVCGSSLSTGDSEAINVEEL